MRKAILDRWAQWLLERRFGGNLEKQKSAMEYLGQVRDKVLGNAQLKETAVLADIGTGDGLIAFGALATINESGKVIFVDISDDLLEHIHKYDGLDETTKTLLTQTLNSLQILREPADKRTWRIDPETRRKTSSGKQQVCYRLDQDRLDDAAARYLVIDRLLGEAGKKSNEETLTEASDCTPRVCSSEEV